MGEKLSLKLVKLFRLYLKLIPISLAILFAANTILGYFGIHFKIFAHIVIFILISFVYIASYVLKFCEYHRMFLHYIVITYITKCYDYYIGIPLNDFNMLVIYSVIMFFTIVIAIYLKLKHI
jgi:hypothetical protein